jgi:hypothetical protein
LVWGDDGADAGGVSNVICLDGDIAAVVEVWGKGGGFRSFVIEKMVDATDDSFDGACKRVGDDAICGDLAISSIFVCEVDVRGAVVTVSRWYEVALVVLSRWSSNRS